MNKNRRIKGVPVITNCFQMIGRHLSLVIDRFYYKKGVVRVIKGRGEKKLGFWAVVVVGNLRADCGRSIVPQVAENGRPKLLKLSGLSM